MIVTDASWKEYLENLRKVDVTAAAKMSLFLDKHRGPDGFWNDPETRQMILDYAYGLSTKYGEAAAELACEMYDALGVLEGLTLPAATPAATATYGEVAKAVNGVMKVSSNVEMIASAVGREVKLAGVDTTMQNAIRDGAEWAWIASGDTCAYCIMLSSRGWQKASEEALKGGHAEHVHGNCDCTYAVRHSKDTNVQGYKPEKYLRMYQKAEGNNTNEKLNAMRREFYEENKEEINAQKRDAYAKRKELNEPSAEEFNVN